MQDVKKIVADLTEKYDTRDPFTIADYLCVHVQRAPLGKIYGGHMHICNQKFIYVNSDKPDNIQKIVAAHELGHAVMHSEDFYFFTWGDDLIRSKAEIEAHTFAAELLVPDSVIYEHEGFTLEQLARVTGYTEKLLQFKKL